MKTRILLVDDHAIVRDGLALLIDAQPDMEVVGQAGDGNEALERAERLAPDVVLLDVSMPELGGAPTAETLRSRCPNVKILALTRHADQGYVRRMLAAGASGYVLKKTARDSLLQAIRIVAAGGTYIEPSLAGGLVERALRRSNTALAHRRDLAPREEEVLRLIAWGHSNKQIAGQLGISVKTVESYKATAVEKLGLPTRTDILRYALSRGWLSEDASPD
ncbi:MAG TPA: response regulator transcription factor [Burkholderiaceae bacterium]|jgi:two-component system, NarL family, response regulator NreC|nr:response regulator transcription factor [Burkholderiaceae bacterium]